MPAPFPPDTRFDLTKPGHIALAVAEQLDRGHLEGAPTVPDKPATKAEKLAAALLGGNQWETTSPATLRAAIYAVAHHAASESSRADCLADQQKSLGAEVAYLRHRVQDLEDTLRAARTTVTNPGPKIGPAALSEFDFLELECFASKVEREGFGYAAEEYAPRFEHRDYEPLTDKGELRNLLGAYRHELATFRARPDAIERHNAHVDEAHRRADERCLWAARGPSRIVPCEAEHHARLLINGPNDLDTVLWRDAPGGAWTEVLV